MYQTYASAYANEVHQLTVSVSKHFFVTKKGALKYQRKPMEFNLGNLAKAEKTQVLNYLIRDHYSGVFYVEIHSSEAIVPVEEFLFRAWSEKEKYQFCGAPEALSVPQTVRKAFPGISKLMEDYGIQPISVTSGFQSGAIRDIKTWENILRQYVRMEGKSQMFATWTPAITSRFSAYLNGPRPEGGSKIQKWSHALNEVRLPPQNGWYSERTQG